ncbi:PAS domain S-box protein [Vampirovibrio sp.]|uniref:sensor histidine kinase n=1 Tax=Vampirovibrio sp. TaxID=2717857 RepID=UPI0035945C39
MQIFKRVVPEFFQTASREETACPATEKEETAKRLTLRSNPAVISGLFLMLLITIAGFSVYTLELNQQRNDLVQVLIWQRKLREYYIVDLYTQSQGLPANPNKAVAQILHNLNVMRYGGSLKIPGKANPFHFQAASHPAIQNELSQKIKRYQQLKVQGEQLSKIKTGTPAYQTGLQAFHQSLSQMDAPRQEILEVYANSLDQALNTSFWIEMLGLLIACGIGLTLSLQQQQSSQSLSESERRFRKIFDAGPLGKILIGADDKVLRVNEALKKMLGYSERQWMTHHPIDTLTHPADWEQEKPLREALLKGHIEYYQLEKRCKHADGHYVWTLSSTALINNQAGVPGITVIQMQDISAQKQALEALQASENQYRTIIELAMDGIMVADKNNIIITANSYAHRIFGYESEQLTGEPLSRMMPALCQEEFLKHLKLPKPSLKNQFNDKRLVLEALKKDGTVFTAEVSLSSWDNTNEERLTTAIIRDITERTRLQREREALLETKRNLEEFTLIASHDLQEPLRKISFYAERFSHREAERMKEESRHDIKRMLSATHRMQNLMSDLLAYARVSSQSIRMAPIQLNHILEELALELSSEIKLSKAHLDIEALPVIEADENHMRILFRNLLQNALKYGQLGVSPHIRIYGKLIEPNPYVAKTPFLEIHVADNGIGFDEKYLDRIFKVFQKLHSQSEFSGTGVGLATCKKIVDLHAGSITAISKPGQGSTFIVTLPTVQKSIAPQ